MNRKAKGTNAERELIKLLWEQGFAAHRVAGSGSVKFPAPDIIAGTPTRKLAIECKSVKGDKKYFSHAEMEQLQEFARGFGAEPWVAVRFDKTGWYFFSPEELKSTGNHVVATKTYALQLGLTLQDVAQKEI